MNTQELVNKNLIVKMYAGSYAYGTNITGSDIDFRGIFCGDPINIRTPFFPIEEFEDKEEIDTKIYELANFMKLCLQCNPNIIELLYTDPNDIIFSTPAYQILRAHRSDFLSSKIAFTTSGYAISQLKRIKGHNKWITNPQPEKVPVPAQFITMIQWYDPNVKMMPRDFNIYQFNTDYRLIPYGNDIFGMYKTSGYQCVSDNGSLNVAVDEEFAREQLGVPLAIIKWNRSEYTTAKEKHSQYWTWKKNRNVVRSELEEGFGYDCYSDDTEFLTNTGWKKFDEVSNTDTLATFNQYSQKLEYQSPTEKIEGSYTGNLYHLTGYHTDILVTANHNMYVRPYSRSLKKQGNWVFERAAELSETFDTLNIIRPKINRQLLPSGVNETLFNHVSMLDYMRLVGWYVSDGTMNFSNPGIVKSMMISQSKPQSKLTQTLSKQINSGKIKCNQYEFEPRGIANYPERRWVFNSELSQIIYQDCGHKSESKRLPKWCFFLTRREMTSLIVALLQGDGTKKDHQNHTYVYYTIHKLLADDVQRLAFLCGFETSLYGPYNINSTFETKNQMYHVHINMRPKLTRRHVRSAAINKISVTAQRIVCFMVNNYTLVTRRNGHIGLHGNTKHAMHLVRLLRMGKEVLTTGEVLVKRPDAQELLAIRNGAWEYDDLVKYAEDMDKEIQEVLYPKTHLRKYPNIQLAAEVLMEVQDSIWSK